MSTTPNAPTGPRLSAEETQQRGEAIYWRDIRPKVLADHRGEFVAIDVVSGEWTLASSEFDARELLHEAQPDAIDVWMRRVGHRVLHYYGFRPLREEE